MKRKVKRKEAKQKRQKEMTLIKTELWKRKRKKFKRKKKRKRNKKVRKNLKRELLCLLHLKVKLKSLRSQRLSRLMSLYLNKMKMIMKTHLS